MQVQSSSNLAKNIRINSLSVADSGTGKTHFLGSICNHGKLFVIDTENGLLSIADKDFDYITIDSWDEFGEAYKWFLKNYEEKGYTHLGVDSVTRLQQYLVDKISKGTGKISQNEWGVVLASLRKMIDHITKTCPTHVHMTAMAMESKDELTGATKIYPNIQGSFKHDLCGYFDLVLNHQCGPDKEGKQAYWVQTKGDRRIIARSRLESLIKLNNKEPSDYKIVAKLIKGS